MRFELWSYDAYGQGSIVASNKEIEPVIKAARDFTTDANLANALTSSEQESTWEAYFPVLMKGKSVRSDLLYAGNRKNGKHQAWTKDKKGNYAIADLPKDANVQFVLGEVVKGAAKERKTETWFFSDHKGTIISDLNHPDLQGKTQLFLKVIP